MNTKRRNLGILVTLGIISSLYPGACEVSPIPFVLLFSGPFLLYGVIFLISKSDKALAGCTTAIAVSLALTLLSQYTLYQNCGINSNGWSALPYFIVTVTNYAIAGLAFFITLNNYFRKREQNQLTGLGSFFSTLGIFVMVAFIIASLLEAAK